MSRWLKLYPLKDSRIRDEVWTDQINSKKYNIRVTYGKELEIFDLKVHEMTDYAAAIRRVRKKCKKIFASKDTKRINKCLVCGASANNSVEVFAVYTATYKQCNVCSHVYLEKYAHEKYLYKYYSKSRSYQKTYAEVKNSKIRVEGVAKPKAQWAVAEYKRIFKKKPTSILDIGAGSGHFVRACRDLGLKADGIEFSETGRKFSKNFFDVELISADFARDWKKFAGYDIVTFWGVVEHVTEPIKLLKTARSTIAVNNGLVIAAVPHWSSFSTAVQKVFPKTIVRHLDPSGHVSCFTDASIATAFVKAGLDISSAWYYGMDAYELLTQSTFFMRDKKLIELFRPSINQLQFAIDGAMLSDEIALAGKVAK